MQRTTEGRSSERCELSLGHFSFGAIWTLGFRLFCRGPDMRGFSGEQFLKHIKRGFGKERFVRQGGMTERFGQRFAAITGNESNGHAFPRQGCRNLITGSSSSDERHDGKK